MDIQGLLNDWIGGRDSGSAIFATEDNRSHWELRSNRSTAEYILKGKTDLLDLARTAYRLCKIRCDNLSGKTSLLIFHPDQSKTNGVQVYVSTDVLDAPNYSNSEKIEVLIGLTTHEAGHLKYTDFKLRSDSPFQHTIWNILEDEMLEHTIGMNEPGYSLALAASKKYYFEDKYLKKDFTGDLEEVFDCFFKFVRYPKYIDHGLVEKHFDILSKVKELLTPFPSNSGESHHASKKIADLLQENIGDQIAIENQANNGRKVKSDQDVQEELQATLNRISGKMEDLNQTTVGKLKMAGVLAEANECTLQVVEGTAEFNTESNTYFIKGSKDATPYRTIKNSIINQARSLADILKIDNRMIRSTISGLRNGNLMASKMTEAILGVEDVYEQSIESEITGFNVAILFDESGSMGYKDKIKNSRKVAAMFYEAYKLQRRGELFMYGYTSDYEQEGTNCIFIYKEPGYNFPETVASMEARACNRDGICILEVAKRIRTFSKMPCLLMIVSDGLPSGHGYNGAKAIEDTARAVEIASKMGFRPIQIGIDVDSKQQSKMFKEFITLSDSKQMIKSLKTLLLRRPPSSCN